MNRQRREPAALDLGAYETWVRDELSRLFGVTVTRGWNAFPGLMMYSPRVDVAVGPFSMGEGTLGDDYDRLSRRFRTLLRRLHEGYAQNVKAFDPMDPAPALDEVLARNW